MIIRCGTCHGGLQHGYGGGHPPGYTALRRMKKSIPSDDRGAFLPGGTNAFSSEKALQKTSVTCYLKDIRGGCSAGTLYF